MQLEQDARLLDNVLEAFASNTPEHLVTPSSVGGGGGVEGGDACEREPKQRLHLEPLGIVDTEAAWEEASVSPDACAAVIARLQEHVAALNLERLKQLTTGK